MEPLQFGFLWSLHISLPWSIAERTQASYPLPRILGERCLVVSKGKSFLKFPQATQHLAAMALSQPPHHPGSRMWLPPQAWCRRHPLKSQFRHRWAATHPYTWGRYSMGLWNQESFIRGNLQYMQFTKGCIQFSMYMLMWVVGNNRRDPHQLI